jgi:hypothetical protein
MSVAPIPASGNLVVLGTNGAAAAMPWWAICGGAGNADCRRRPSLLGLLCFCCVSPRCSDMPRTVTCWEFGALAPPKQPLDVGEAQFNIGRAAVTTLA